MTAPSNVTPYGAIAYRLDAIATKLNGFAQATGADDPVDELVAEIESVVDDLVALNLATPDGGDTILEISDEFSFEPFPTDAAGRPFDPELRIPRIPTSEAIWPQVREILGLPHDRFTPIRIEIDETGAYCHTSIFLTAGELRNLVTLASNAGADLPETP